MQQNYAGSVEYFGSRFHGWQTQKHARSVQEELEKAISIVANEKVSVQCSGRTDAGVHAINQVFSFCSTAQRDARSWLYGVNANLPNDVSLNWIVPVDKDFNARFSAQARYYRYIILQSPHRSALFNQKVLWERNPLDINLMNQAGHYLLGEHDFSAFRSAQCQAKHAWRYLESINVHQQQNMIFIDIVGNAFLQNMVRIITGMLLEVGKGKQPPQWAQFLLQSKDRTLGAKTAAACGLYFMYPRYEDKFQLPDYRSYPGLE